MIRLSQLYSETSGLRCLKFLTISIPNNKAYMQCKHLYRGTLKFDKFVHNCM